MKEDSVSKEEAAKEIFVLDEHLSYVVESAEGASEESEVDLIPEKDDEAFDKAMEGLISEAG